MSKELSYHLDVRHASATHLPKPVSHKFTTIARSKSLEIPSLIIHTFQWHTYKKPTKCAHCEETLTGLVKQGLQCKRCEINVHSKCENDLDKPCVDFTPGEHNFCLKTYKKPKYCDFCHKLLAGLRNQGYTCSECGTNVHDTCQYEIEKSCEKAVQARQKSKGILLSPREDLKPLKVDWDQIGQILSEEENDTAEDSSMEASPGSSPSYSISSGTTSSPPSSDDSSLPSDYSSDSMTETLNIIIEEEDPDKSENSLRRSSETENECRQRAENSKEQTNEERRRLLKVDESVERSGRCTRCRLLTAISVTLAATVSFLTVLVFYLVKSK